MNFKTYFKRFIGWLLILAAFPMIPILMDRDLFFGFTISMIQFIIASALIDPKEDKTND